MFRIVILSGILGLLRLGNSATFRDFDGYSQAKLVFVGDEEGVEVPDSNLAAWWKTGDGSGQSEANIRRDMYTMGVTTWIKPTFDPSNNSSISYIVRGVEHKNPFQVFTIGTVLHYKLGDTIYKCFTDSSMVQVYELPEEQWSMVMLVFTGWDFNNYRYASSNVYSDIVVKPLDKTTSPKGLYCIQTVAADPETSPKGARDNLILGGSFSGEIAQVHVDELPPRTRGYSYSENGVTENNNWLECLKDKDVPRCRDTLNMAGTNDHLKGMKYDILEGSITRMELDDSVRTFFNTDFSCKDMAVEVSVRPDAWDIAEPTTRSYPYYSSGYRNYRSWTYYAANLTLGSLDHGCNFTWDSTTDLFTHSASLSDCGFRRRPLYENSTEELYINMIYSHTATETRRLARVACTYTPRPALQQQVTIPGFVVQDPAKMGLTANHTFSEWTMSLALYSDSDYTKQLSNPVRFDYTNLAGTPTVLFVEARVETGISDDSSVSLLIESCKTRVSLGEGDVLESSLIDRGVPTKKTVKLVHSEGKSRRRFKFRPARFEEYPNALVYLSCFMTAKKE